MEFEIGQYVTRNSYNNDTIFVIIDIKDDNYFLKGVDIRLYADAQKEDLVSSDYKINDDELVDRIINRDMDRGEYFYLPAKILHIDADHLCNSEFEKVL